MLRYLQNFIFSLQNSAAIGSIRDIVGVRKNCAGSSGLWQHADTVGSPPDRSIAGHHGK